MKKSLLALAVLGAFASVASAQSSVTLYGRVDLSGGKNMGSTNKFLQNGSGSRFGVRGSEDLGGGMSAFFNIEHRYNADTGAMTDATRFWGGRSIVGLQGAFGQFTLGREYTTAFLQSQLAGDPWGWDTVANQAAITGLGIARVRNDSSGTYRLMKDGFTFGVQMAEATDAINNFAKKPFNMALSYNKGPIVAGFGYEKTGQRTTADAKVTTANLSYNFGPVRLGGFVGRGTTATNVAMKSYMLTAVAPMGAGDLRASIGRLQANGVTTVQNYALGYHYNMSKRTTLYADYTANTKLVANKNAYDFGIKHNF